MSTDHPVDFPVRQRSRNGGNATGGSNHFHGASNSVVLALAVLAALSFGATIVGQVQAFYNQRTWDRQFQQAQDAWKARSDAQERIWRNQFDVQERTWRDRFDAQAQQAKDTKLAATLLERRYIDLESYAMLNGWKVPKDEAHGPTGNLERMTGKEKALGRK